MSHPTLVSTAACVPSSRSSPRGDSELRADYEQIVDQVRQTKDSTLQVDTRRFDTPVDRIEGTIKKASFHGVELAGMK